MCRETSPCRPRLGGSVQRQHLAIGLLPCAVAAILLAIFSTLLTPATLWAQDNGSSLGDLARNLRRQRAQQELQQGQAVPPAPVIDNDNLKQALDDVHRIKSAENIVFSIDPNGKNFRFSSPDVSCSLAFNGRNSSLLIQPVLVEDVPLADLLKLDGPASIEDDTLQLDLQNGTDWELREITVGITLERSPTEDATLAARARVIPAADNSSAATIERRSDMTLLFHLKADAKPFSDTVFRENIGITPSPDEDWRWSIVSAKGVRVGPKTGSPETFRATPQLPLPNPLPPAAGPRPASAPTAASSAPTASTLPAPNQVPQR
jgi:hypothetical protein